MNCASCGHPVVTGADRCRACGTALRVARDATVGGGEVETVGGGVPGDPAGPTAGPLRAGEVFAGRYHVRRVLGAGGMGAVYEAWDEAVGIPVALKIIRPEAAIDPDVAADLEARLRRELVLARQVTHRNVVRIHDLGEMDGVTYLTMSFIEGEELAERLRRAGSLPVSEALRLIRGVVAGLAAAHEAGVVHRDLKPGNIMIEAATGQPYIMDFGIARSADGVGSGPLAPLQGRAPAAAGTTQAGSLLGTIRYMAPEQFLGEAVDGRADVYAVGLILYDLLLGPRRPRDPDGALADLRRRAEQPPPAPRAVDSAIPEALNELVIRCLQPDPEQRFAGAAELAAELDRLDDDGHPLRTARTLTGRLVAVAAVVVVVLLAGTWWAASGRTPRTTPAPLGILVADLDNRTGEPWFDGAVEQALAIAMEGAGFISAYPRAAARRTATTLELGDDLDDETARLVSRREGLGIVLSSRLERDGGAYRLTVRALDPAAEADDGRPVARVETRAKEPAGVLRAVGEAGSRLRKALGDTAPSSQLEAAAETFTAASPAAMSAYARGQALAAQGEFDRAIESYREAVTADPAFGRAYAGMGVVYGNLRRADEAEASFQAALEHLDRMTERERFRTLGAYYLLVSHNYEKAIESFSELVDRYPADGAGHSNLAFAYLNVRDFDRAVESGRRAVELEPNSVIKRINLAIYAMQAGRFDTAIEQSLRVLEQNPSFGYALFTFGRSALASGDRAAAAEAFERLGELDGPGASLSVLGEADMDLYLGDPAAAVDTLEHAAVAPASDFERAMRLIALAEARAAAGAPGAADAARQAVGLSEHESVLHAAARVMIGLGDTAAALELADRLAAQLQSQAAASAALVRGEVALQEGRLADALRLLRDARTQHDSWFCHFLMGRTYLEAGHLAEALDELDDCVRRRGEVVDVSLTDGATLRYYPPALYWLGRVHEAMGNRPAAEALWTRYLELRGAARPADELAADTRRRLGIAS